MSLAFGLPEELVTPIRKVSPRQERDPGRPHRRPGPGGEILVSSLLKELTENAGDIAFGDGREAELKGLAGTHQVHQIQWE